MNTIIGVGEKIVATGILGAFFGLLGVIGRDVYRRIAKVEMSHDQMFKAVIETSLDVKHIRRHCAKCNEGEI